MRLLIDGRTIKNNPSGLGIWNIRLVERLLHEKEIQKIHLILPLHCTYDVTSDPVMKNQLGKKLEIIEASHTYKFIDTHRFLFEQVKLRQLIQELKPDVYHATDSFGIPLMLPSGVKTVLTVHDLIPLTPYREYLSWFTYQIYKLSLGISIRRADVIVAISDKTQADLRSYLNVETSRMRVIYDGVDPIHDIPASEETNAWKTVSQEYALEKNNYVLYYGGFGGRRNVYKIIDVFAELKQKGSLNSSVKLVLSGRVQHAKNEALRNLNELKELTRKYKLENDIIFMDYLAPSIKTVLIKNCKFFISLSAYEGFGLGPIEVLQYNKEAFFTSAGIWDSFKEKNTYVFKPDENVATIYKRIAESLIHREGLTQEQKQLRYFTKDLSWDTMAKEYIRLYQSLVHI